jgi:uncharacterized protein (DUF1697 family)
VPVYIAMLRGINVGGQKPVKMEELRSSFVSLQFKQVRTYVQSGNVIFYASKASSTKLSELIKERISGDFGFQTPVVLRSSAEMKKIVHDNPFLKDTMIDRSRLHVTFLSQLPATGNNGRLDGLDSDPDQFRVCGQEIYLYCPNGYGRSKLSNNAIEKLLWVEATTRNWKTVNTLAEMSSE